MNKAYKFRIYPNEVQKTKIEKTFNCVRFIYNKMLTDKIEYFNKTGRKLNNTPAQYKKEFPWLKEVDSLALANAQLHLNAAYESFFRNPEHGFPKFKSRKRCKKSYTTNCVYGNIAIRDGSIKLPKIGFIKMKQHREIPVDYQLKSVTVSRNAKGNYYASVLFEYETEITAIQPESSIELAYSAEGLYVDGKGREVNYPDYIRRTSEKLKQEKQRLSHMKYLSNHREKQRIRVMQLRQKLDNQITDFLHKQSRQIANAYDRVCIKESGDIVKGDFGWGTFKILLKYKLSDKGKLFVMNMLYSRQAV